MKDFEDQIKQMRGHLDGDGPNLDRMWEGMDQKLHRRKQPIRQLRYWAAAAVILVVFGAGYFVSQGLQTGPAELPMYTVADLDPEAAEEEVRLRSDLDEQLAILANYEMGEEDARLFLEELDEIDQLDREMRAMLGKVQNQEKLLRTLLDHYRKKIRLIDRMIKKLEKEKRNENRIYQTRA